MDRRLGKILLSASRRRIASMASNVDRVESLSAEPPTRQSPRATSQFQLSSFAESESVQLLPSLVSKRGTTISVLSTSPARNPAARALRNSHLAARSAPCTTTSARVTVSFGVVSGRVWYTRSRPARPPTPTNSVQDLGEVTHCAGTARGVARISDNAIAGQAYGRISLIMVWPPFRTSRSRGTTG